MGIPLLTTKFGAPPARLAQVARPFLLHKLDEVLLPGCRLALLSAPAGFGKTTLLSEWAASLAERGVVLAWLTLDAADSDLGRFLQYLVATVQKVYPQVGHSARALLELPPAPPVETVLTGLVNELAELPADFVLVLDDYHTLNGRAVHPAMVFLLEHCPAQMHLVVLTRLDPLLPLARLRARGQMVELRSGDLRFSQEEAATFLNQMLGRLHLTADQVVRLETQTEGWIAGLQMAALSMRGRQDIEGFLDAFSAGHPFVFEYLAQEVFEQLEQPVRDFLDQTAFLERLCASLCDFVTGREDSRAVLEYMEQANLFLNPLDDQCCWYRYHPLFASFLRHARRAAPAKAVAALHLKAARWFETNDLPAEAIEHSLAAKDFDLAARLINRVAVSMIRGGGGSLLAWLNALPEELVRSSSELSTYKGWALMGGNRLDDSLACASAAEKVLSPDTSRAVRARLLSLQAYLNYGLGNQEQALQLGARAVELLGEDEPFFLSMVLTMLGQIQRQSGSIEVAEQTFRQAVRAGERLGSNMGYYVAQANLAHLIGLRGQRRQADAHCQSVIAHSLDEHGRESPLAFFVHLPWAGILYDANQLAEARQHLEHGFEVCRRLGFSPIMAGGSETLAFILFAEGQTQAALDFVQEGRRQALDFHLPWIAIQAQVVEAWFSLRLGDIQAAQRWAQEAHLSLQDARSTDRGFEYLTLARLLLAERKLEDGRTLLGSLLQAAQQAGRYTTELQCCILLALLEQQASRKDEARRWTARALQMAAPQDYLRMFLDEGAEVRALLAEFRLKVSDVGFENSDFKLMVEKFISRLLAAFDQPAGTPAVWGAVQNPQSAIKNHKSEILVEPLSPRELEVLALMAGGLSNAEIARKLYLTVNTLKAHTNSIYGKLDVHSRMQAVIRARELGLLPPEV